MNKVLDAHALMAFLEKEETYKKIEVFFVDAAERNHFLLMTSVNFGEVYYIILRECGRSKVEEFEKIMQNLPIEIIDVDIPLAKAAGCFKATKKMSYADCFAAALAKTYRAELITGDKEFREVEDEIKVLWI